ncbi:pyrimidine reductase family protein [Streptomyces himalayensis]|uniref:Pyrimidine reductase family protein n=1 Tax=Streptomyces himalayensis subsp. himalayensis TaxID=2756131 RepID=A0A7W0DN41_9ACTN|nr:pyrimidine reductase family protein [Streptomyces himalayensis]MBA2947698.1 pyrimidine reductase family protein [Streptomyces himalayensis subsp. himalayensis]
MRRLFPVTYETADRTSSTADRGGAPCSTGAESLGEGFAQSADREWGLEELAEAYAYPGDRDVWLRANMVSTLDGAAQHEGRSQPISCETDMRIFGTLRGLADAVVVGAETVRLEGYRPARAREAFAARRAAAGQGPAPAIAVVSASLELDFSLPLFTEPLVPTLLVTGAAAPLTRLRAAEAAGVEVVIAGEGAGAEPARIVRALADRGLRRLLTEGGPRLLGQFVAADALDELCLTLSPMVASGAAQRIVGGPEMDVLKRFALSSLLEDTGFLFARYRRK